MAQIFKKYVVSPGEFITGDFDTNFSLHLYNEASGEPSWFTWLSHPFLGALTGWQFTAPSSLGIYTVLFNELKGGVLYNWQIQIVVTVFDQVYNNCCDNQRDIAWLNKEGGWQNYIFTGVRTIRHEINGDNTYETSDYVTKYSEIEKVYNAEIITTGDVPKSHIDIIDSLRDSIQAFLWNDETQAYDIPILVEKKSVTKYKTNDKFYEANVKFKYAERLIVQTQ